MGGDRADAGGRGGDSHDTILDARKEEKVATKSGRGGRAVVRIPPTFFGIALGLSGLSALWVFAGTSFGAPAAFGDALGVLAAVVWIGLTLAYLRQGPRRILADARDATVGPFLAAPVMTAYVLAADVLEPHAPGAARTIVIAFLAIGLLVSGLLTGQWLSGGLEEETFGPAFFLPTIGIGFVGADAAATVGLYSIAELFFGIGRDCTRGRTPAPTGRASTYASATAPCSMLSS